MMRKEKSVTRCSIVLFVLLISGILCGCKDSREDTVLIGRTVGEATESRTEEAVSGAETPDQETPEQESVEPNVGEKTDAGEVAQQIYVYVCGAVNNPGVVCLAPDSRVEAALNAAGGFAQGADREYVNLAAWVADGAQIYFPTEEETKAADWDAVAGTQRKQDASDSEAAETEKVNINTANVSVLCTLPGIGEARARDIIAYRENNGSFLSEEDIMKVSGIKTAVYEEIKDRITVR